MFDRYDERDVPSGTIVMRQQKSALHPVARATSWTWFRSSVSFNLENAGGKRSFSEDEWDFRANPNVNKVQRSLSSRKPDRFSFSGENRVRLKRTRATWPDEADSISMLSDEISAISHEIHSRGLTRCTLRDIIDSLSDVTSWSVL